MTTAQAAPNGPRLSPPPGSAGNPAGLNSADLPTDKDHNKSFPAGAYHVPPDIYVPEARAYRDDEPRNSPHLPGPLPDRCQFMFSDGRQCTMARSDIHPTLCFYHADREEQLFGDPTFRFETRKLDFPELYSASRDLSTAASVNRVLAQVFRLFAQRRISRQEAATFAHLAKLLLRTISLMVAEAEVQPEKRLPPASLPLHEPQRRPVAHVALVGNSPETPLPSSPVDTIGVPGEPRSSVETPSAASVYNPPGISTYRNAKLQPVQNQHLQKLHDEIPPNIDQNGSGFPGAPSFATLAQASPGD